MKYRLRNWAHFQHYKDRNPPWIKLHFELLSSADWVVLADASRVVAIACMLVGSRDNGEIDGSPTGLAYLRRVAYLNEPPNLKPLIECGFLEPASAALADASELHTNAIPETETETETEKSNDSPNGESSASADADAPTKSDPIPYKAIIDGYNRELTNLGKARELTPKRRSLIRSAWQASPDRRSLDFWNAYWAECQADDFLNGTGPYREPHANWRPNFDYLLRADVVTRTFERAMDRLERAE